MFTSIITRGCNLLGQNNAVSALVRELVPFNVPAAEIEPSQTIWLPLWRACTAYFWWGSLLLLAVCFGLVTSGSTDAERLSDALGSAGFWLIVVPCVSFAAIGLFYAPEISGPVLAVNLLLLGFVAWKLIKRALTICTVGLLWSWLDERRRR
jgi:hypothetical protein